MERWPLVGAETMRALDRHTIETLGVPGEILMESAGRAVAEVVLAEAPAGPVLVVCGAGNNGGDGLVVARHLALLGVPVRVALLGEPARLRGDAAANWKRLARLDVTHGGASFRTAGAAVILDAVFGTGLAREVKGPAAAAIRRINAARPGARVVAVDLPSGLDADTGQVLGAAVEADVTVTIGLPKLGLALEPGRTHAGRVVVARIGIADDAPGVRADAELWRAAGAASSLPARPSAGHKGSFGHVLVAAGSRGKSGAAALAAHGAARAGAGLVTVACPAGLNEILEVKCTEMMTAPVPDTPEQGFSRAALAPLAALARERDVTALGPGIGREDETCKLVLDLAARIARPLVLDADGLFPFAQDPGALKGRRAATILTPHPGEAARLLGTTAGRINADRVGAAQRLAETTGGVVLLKGAASVIADRDGRIAINPTGGPGLGTGGTGDVLTGVVAGLLGQGAPAFEAAALGAWLHGFASDRLAARCGTAGVLAGELAAELPAALEALRARAGAPAEPGLALAFP
ncbi:MAG: NAD(P)H-hydrate dehydratase [Myxococcota bacterium]|nr:NAD(P)H-hydrate dehydratase [Myxococcota bacterium]